jgi:hypothetical protein
MGCTKILQDVPRLFPKLFPHFIYVAYGESTFSLFRPEPQGLLPYPPDEFSLRLTEDFFCFFIHFVPLPQGFAFPYLTILL